MKTGGSPNARLRLHGQLRGWRLADVASGLQRLSDEPLGVDEYMVSRWERGVRRPGPRYVRLLCQLFELPGDLLGLVEGSSDVDLLLPGGGQITAVDRRDFLAVASLALGGIALNPLSTDAWASLTDAAAVEAAAEVIPRYRRLEGAVPSAELLGTVHAHLQLTLRLLRNAATPAAHGRLAAAASEAASFAAWLQIDVGDMRSAQERYRLAIEVANRADAPLLAGYQLGSLASLATDAGNPAEALALLRAAERKLPRPAPAISQAWLASLRAGAHAVASEALAAHRALAAVENAIAGLQDEPVWPWLTPFSADKLAAARGTCELRLGRTVAAIEALQIALASSTLTIRRRGEVLADLAAAHVRRKEPEQAFGALGKALTIATNRRSPFLMERIRLVRARVDRTWDSRVEVADFDERLHTTWL